MVFQFNEYLIDCNADARQALHKLDALSDKISRTLFVIDETNRLKGAITDGDIRRGLLAGREISESVQLYMNKHFKYLYEDQIKTESIKDFKARDIQLLPILNREEQIVKILDLKSARSVIPAEALIMAGGKGERLRPLTDTIPKPMIRIGDKPILEHNIDRLISFGINKIYISVNYLRNVIIDYFGDGSSKGIEIVYVEENRALGTLGALSLINAIASEDLLVMNSDILTDMDFEDFYLFYKSQGAMMAVASIPYHINVPYAVLDIKDHTIHAFKEKPSYTYYSNGGIYFLKAKLKSRVLKDEVYNATDLMDSLIQTGDKLIHYPVLSYWLDIGKYPDYMKAQDDIKHIKL